mmetsp:Transcript_3455/g.6302  ORF Transcript_3455/g.6302 Transcript_3455/m.6302 type:complete len:222 (+) Transcript_3455:1184-1849(+)
MRKASLRRTFEFNLGKSVYVQLSGKGLIFRLPKVLGHDDLAKLVGFVHFKSVSVWKPRHDILLSGMFGVFQESVQLPGKRKFHVAHFSTAGGCGCCRRRGRRRRRSVGGDGRRGPYGYCIGSSYYYPRTFLGSFIIFIVFMFIGVIIAFVLVLLFALCRSNRNICRSRFPFFILLFTMLAAMTARVVAPRTHHGTDGLGMKLLCPVFELLHCMRSNFSVVW